MTRYRTFLEDGTVYVGTDDGRLRVGELETVLAAVGGPAWTISYTDAEKERHPGLDTSDEGLTVDVVDMARAMTFGERFVETMAAHPAEPPDRDSGEGGRPEERDEAGGVASVAGDRVADDEARLSPRMGLFVGKLLENLENGID